MAFGKKQEVVTLPSGEAVTIRGLLASEARELGVSGGGEPTGAQMRQIICVACLDPKVVDSLEPPEGTVSIYDLGARDEMALLNAILTYSYRDFVPAGDGDAPFSDSDRGDSAAVRALISPGPATPGG